MGKWQTTILYTICILLLQTSSLAQAASASATGNQDDALNKQLAQRVVRSAGVKPGNVVIIDGGKQVVPLMESIAIEVGMAGGWPIMFYESDRVQRAFYKDVPDKYLEQEPRFYAEWFKNADVYIGLPGLDDPKAVIADVAPDRMAKMGKASHFFVDVINALPVREIDLEYPTRAAATAAGMELNEYEKLMFAGIATDYDAVSKRGKDLQELLRTAKQLRVTTPAGTDIMFSMASARGVFLDDGLVSENEAKAKTFTERYVLLPGGSVYFAPLENSANGKVVAARVTCRFQPFDKAVFNVKDGKMIGFQAGSNQACFDAAWKANTGQFDQFGSVWIGLNPDLHVVETDKANFRHTNIAGLVTIGFGDNRIYGGSLDSVGGSGFALPNATVTVDGKTIIKDGKLMF